MTARTLATAIEPLVDLLADLSALHDELATVLSRKLDAMRHADTPAMQSAAAREAFLVERIAHLDLQRHAVISEVVAAIGLPKGETPAVSRIAAALGEPDRSRLLVLAQGLRQRMLKVAETNRIVALVTGEILAHYRTVFAAMTRAADDSDTYGHPARRTRAPAPSACVLDAVG